ncbi:hypothetical protein [Streptomyces sp. NPDC058385]|uniref:hypothetical protein n=1 Tax=Streptomyces sp. NPDC058385 TaxID=3346473 RepID=UPI00364A7D05
METPFGTADRGDGVGGNVAVAAHSTVVLAAVPDTVSRTLSIVGLDQVFPAHPTAQAAEAAWTPSTG